MPVKPPLPKVLLFGQAIQTAGTVKAVAPASTPNRLDGNGKAAWDLDHHLRDAVPVPRQPVNLLDTRGTKTSPKILTVP